MEKLYITITGRRNKGKSSLINAITGQATAIVSATPGTTTDPVKRSFEIPGFASVVLTDTAGIDDSGELGMKRVEKTTEILKQADAAILVITDNCFDEPEKQLIEQFRKLSLPFIIVHNKSDVTPILPMFKHSLENKYSVPVIDFSANHREQLPGLIEQLKQLKKSSAPVSLIGDLLHEGDIVMLVTPVDSSAPNGRLILPQVQMIRDILDNRCVCIVLQPGEIDGFFSKTSMTPALVITDSQAFKEVNELIPPHVPLTSFSIVLARHKGNYPKYLEGTKHIAQLQDGDRVLVLESCSHHISCEDIGRVKIPALLQKKTGRTLHFDFIAGLDPIERPLSDYAMVIQCGGCMITARQLQTRLQPFIEAGIPVSNYGMTIAWLQGIFEKATRMRS